MDIAFHTGYLRKRFPLAISRGVSVGNDNLFVAVSRDRITGWGEMAPGIGQGAPDTASGQAALAEFFCDGLTELGVTEIYDRGRQSNIPTCALAALDVALWDWSARKANLPLYRLLGMGKPRTPTSITIGISPPEVVRERVPLLLDGSGIRALKVKLGSTEGIEADQAMFAQVRESIRDYPVSLRVDANGGWNVKQARAMMKWLAAREVEYVEQPLAEGQESELPALFKNRPLPIFLDESCRFADDLPKWAHTVDGVNIKLMKCGGISGALRIIDAARTFALKTMIGCMSESSMAISAAAAISGAVDYVDLDSHLNLDPDPCVGAQLIDGIITPSDAPGHGAAIIRNHINDYRNDHGNEK